MVFTSYDANFISVLPQLRAHDDIVADIQLAGSGRATDIDKSKVARIELAIEAAMQAYKRRQYEPALGQLRQARSEIYALLHPGFDVAAYLLHKDVALPVSAAIEANMLALTGPLAQSIRPIEDDQIGRVFVGDVDGIPDNLSKFTITGFRESVSADELVHSAAIAGVAFLNDNKPDDAIGAMLIAASNQDVDPGLTAALNLNLASAYLQVSDLDRAGKAAGTALDQFSRAEDVVGQAQAIHASAIVADRRGDVDEAKSLFARAAETLARSGPITPADVPPPGDGQLVGGGPRHGRPVPRRELSSVGASALSLGRQSQPGLERMTLTNTTLTARDLGTRDSSMLRPISRGDATTLTVRIPGRVDGWATIPAIDDLQRKQQAKSWNVGIPTGETIVNFAVGSAAIPSIADLKGLLYEKRVLAKDTASLLWPIINTSTTTFYLTQLYAYALPVKIADCYHQLGQYAKAEEYYTQSASYSYVHPEVEATSLWIRMARNAVLWGDSLYKAEKFDDASAQYSKVVQADATVPTSFLYSTPIFAQPAAAATELIRDIAARPLPTVNWEISDLVLTALGRLAQIAEGLDFFGLLLSPIHTFVYLQSVAGAFAQEAIQAEREFVNFTSRQEAEEASRRDLEAAIAMAQAEAQGRYQLYLSAQEDEAAASAALALAIKRRNDAQAQRDAYGATSSAQIWGQAASQALGGGEDAYWNEISALADKLARGETISGPGPKLAAAQTLYAGRKTQAYELQKMQDNIAELTLGITVATEQRDGAARRTFAAELAWQASMQRVTMTAQSLDAFDNEFFTPETWSKMADVMRDIAASYLYRAIRIAKLMERAYNFENDTQLQVIKSDYGHGVATPTPGRDIKLLGGDSLLQDIESFTYVAITTKTRKSSRIKDVISVAREFPAQFEQFRSTGLLSFETDLYEFDRLHPGFYGQHVDAVEIEVIGVLPDTGLNGTLSGGGVTSFRTRNNASSTRVNKVDTMAISSFVLRADGFVYGTEEGVKGLFQGIGLGGTWQLHLPKRSNDLDFRRIFDVNLVLYYNATFDVGLRSTVLALPLRPDEDVLLRNFSLRQDFPDSWYGFYRGGVADITFDRLRLPANQTNFTVNAANFRVMTKDGVSNAGIDLRITAPGGATGTATTDADGVISTELPGLASLKSGSPVGAWKFEVLGGAPLDDAGVVKFDRVYSVQWGLEYGFDSVPEVL